MGQCSLFFVGLLLWFVRESPLAFVTAKPPLQLHIEDADC